MNIKEVRTSKGLTQIEACNILNMKLRTYQNYESGKSFRDDFKISQILSILNSYEKYNEKKGILPFELIKKTVSDVASKHDVGYVYLFGSYARGEAKEASDVDLLIDCRETGLSFIGLIDEFASSLHKNVDLIKIEDANGNLDFLNEILKTGVRIYG